tara:strand:- start:139 stop:537 length:399 start_codon:yes stop_codon:yes gene_type:complete
MTTKSSGFTLIELLVVVAILGIISAIGVVSYNGYITGTKKKSAENMMQQIGLAETEEYSSYGSYHGNGEDCSEATTEDIGNSLFGSINYIDTDKIGYYFCVLATGSTYTVHAQSIKPGCNMTLDSSGNFTKC